KKLEGLLLFAQVVEESLFDYTIDTFRPPALNTHYRCVELLYALLEVRRGTLHLNALAPMVEELSVSLQEDQVGRSLLQPHEKALAHELSQRVSRPAELETLIRVIHGRLRPSYRAALEKGLKELLPENREKSQITQITRSWVTHLINEG